MRNKRRKPSGHMIEIEAFLRAVGRFFFLISRKLFPIKPHLSTMKLLNYMADFFQILCHHAI
jgi:hypothetical protein